MTTPATFNLGEWVRVTRLDTQETWLGTWGGVVGVCVLRDDRSERVLLEVGRLGRPDSEAFCQVRPVGTRQFGGRGHSETYSVAPYGILWREGDPAWAVLPANGKERQELERALPLDARLAQWGARWDVSDEAQRELDALLDEVRREARADACSQRW